jgi:hypothetical protein
LLLRQQPRDQGAESGGIESGLEALQGQVLAKVADLVSQCDVVGEREKPQPRFDPQARDTTPQRELGDLTLRVDPSSVGVSLLDGVEVADPAAGLANL